VPSCLNPGGVRSLALGLVFLLIVDGASVWGQQPVSPKLNIVIVEGDEAINNIRQRTAREPIVQVVDENHRPVAGAAVIFLTPQHGPSSVFADGTHSLTVTTDQNGRAVARGLRPNRAAGKYRIQVKASYQGNNASAVIGQVNLLGPAVGHAAGLSGKWIALMVAVAAGGVAGGVYAATRGGNNTVTITPGAPGVGRP
jgi:hypothetical protein